MFRAGQAPGRCTGRSGRPAGKRQVRISYIISGHNSSFLELANILRDHFGDSYPFPRRNLPKFLVWLVGPILNTSLTRKVVSRGVGWPLLCDNSKSVSELGMSYRPLADSVNELFQQLVDNGLV